mmetsp:Transcript_49424/g.107553  ORF Transcript_49424/g.107553 Transcript_49424/m.107553 type:complete len:259 (+) Transcript_49424:599-1375(+)
MSSTSDSGRSSGCWCMSSSSSSSSSSSLMTVFSPPPVGFHVAALTRTCFGSPSISQTRNSSIASMGSPLSLGTGGPAGGSLVPAWVTWPAAPPPRFSAGTTGPPLPRPACCTSTCAGAADWPIAAASSASRFSSSASTLVGTRTQLKGRTPCVVLRLSQVMGASCGSQPVSAVTTGRTRDSRSASYALRTAFASSCGQTTFALAFDGSRGALAPCAPPAGPTGTTSSICTWRHSPCTKTLTTYFPWGLYRGMPSSFCG